MMMYLIKVVATIETFDDDTNEFNTEEVEHTYLEDAYSAEEACDHVMNMFKRDYRCDVYTWDNRNLAHAICEVVKMYKEYGNE